jgi:hypothetical protein
MRILKDIGWWIHCLMFGKCSDCGGRYPVPEPWRHRCGKKLWW